MPKGWAGEALRDAPLRPALGIHTPQVSSVEPLEEVGGIMGGGLGATAFS